MSNHLAVETSPYLLQHADNPVDWYPWGQAALEKAHREDKPIFLSIGYAACHWCHVMAHESFEDPATAEVMNDLYVNIKVDREERPDLDSIYMSAVVAMTGQGGWPMSLFLTPDGQPFYGGTYYPPLPRYGMPAFRDILVSIARVWREDREQVFRVGEQILTQLRESSVWNNQSTQSLSTENLANASQQLVASYDWQSGGWGHAPRFPAPMTIEFLLQQSTRGNNTQALQVAVHLLKAMQRGGMFDVVGGGFHRYSTDDQWLVPHFEKMLYDNAQLALAYLHGYQLTGEVSFRRTCEATLDFILRELAHPQGGFFSSLDADSEGVEGKYYIWTLEEIKQALQNPQEFEFFLAVYPQSAEGNFDSKIILQRTGEDGELAHQAGLSLETFWQRLDLCHHRLLAARSQRIRPHTDDKVLAAWNGLTLRALAEAARALERADYLAAAQKNSSFLRENLYADNRLLRSWREGQARLPGYLEDHGAMILALFAMYQADSDNRWFDWACQLASDLLENFTDPAGGFFDTRADQEKLLIRPKDLQDNATPSGNALAALALLTLSEFTGVSSNRGELEKLLGSLIGACQQYPSAFSFWLQAIDFAVGPIQQIAVVWAKSLSNPKEYLDLIQHGYRPRTVLAASLLPLTSTSPALLQDRPTIKNAPTVYICQGFVCLNPITSLEQLRRQIDPASPPG